MGDESAAAIAGCSVRASEPPTRERKGKGGLWDDPRCLVLKGTSEFEMHLKLSRISTTH
jgi:hypothetical protein